VDRDIYLPNDIWYDYYSKKCTLSNGSIYTIEAPTDTIPLNIRGGYILPVQDPATTTTSRYAYLNAFYNFTVKSYDDTLLKL